MTRSVSHPSRFWPTVALCALVLCGWMAFTHGGPEARADNGGATTAGIISLMGTSPVNEHLFIVDTNNKTILLYEVRNAADLNFVAGRSYEYDSEYLNATPGKFLKYKAAGHDDAVATYVASILKKK
ncbi:MAG: hypothetical protein KIS92_08705 [Planctomycetota bacterium]|nr:hypothetical protein [Planctomycetota bacterium]